MMAMGDHYFSTSQFFRQCTSFIHRLPSTAADLVMASMRGEAAHRIGAEFVPLNIDRSMENLGTVLTKHKLLLGIFTEKSPSAHAVAELWL